jgi:hypothetical protein
VDNSGWVRVLYDAYSGMGKLTFTCKIRAGMASKGEEASKSQKEEGGAG